MSRLCSRMQPCETACPRSVRPRSPVDADDAASRPVGELRVRARLERVRAQDRPLRVDRRIELVGHVEEPERRLGSGLADGHLPRADEPRAVPELELPRAAVDDDPLVTGRSSSAAARTQPVRPFGRPGTAHAVPERPPVLRPHRVERQHVLRPEVRAGTASAPPRAPPRPRLREDGHLPPHDRPRADDRDLRRLRRPAPACGREHAPRQPRSGRRERSGRRNRESRHLTSRAEERVEERPQPLLDPALAPPLP